MSCDASQWSWTNPCTRDYVQSLPPFIVIIATLVFRIPILATLAQPVQTVAHAIRRPFIRFLPLSEAEALLYAGVSLGSGEPSVENASKPKAPLWRTLLFSGLALMECIGWLVISSYRLVSSEGGLGHYTVAPFLTFLSWLPAVIIPVLRPKLTPSYDLFSFYLLQLACSIFWFGTIWYDRDTLGIAVDALEAMGSTVNLVVVLILLLMVLRMPLNVPSEFVDKRSIGKEVSPEDYTPLWSWVTFDWVYPLIRRGTNDTLNEPDVWELSPTMQAKAVHLKFESTARKTLLRRLWAANSLDLILDFTLTFVSVVFNYTGPFFLKRILDAFKDESPEDRSRAYVYAFLAFVASICKAQADVQHLWFGRRAGTRMRSELMASIYAKALVRKDYSGIVDKKDGKQKSNSSSSSSSSQAASDGNSGEQSVRSSRKQAKRDAKANEAEATKNTSGADIGKIVNLMSGDANRIAQVISGAYFIYGAPFEIIIASVFLYQLLGLSAFAGFLILLIGSPLNSFLARRSIRIQRSLLTARDKRMGVLTELINGVKLVKFYGWEHRWIDRVLDARKVELGWLVKSRINQVMFSMLWTTAPILVSIISFLVYILTGHELTIPVAFTAIALFNMLRAPLNIVPAWIVQFIQTGVALDRIATFLHEEEVSDQVSSLKGQGAHSSVVHLEDQQLGIGRASFKWNEVEADKDQTASGTSTGKSRSKTNGMSDTESEPFPSDSISVNDTTSEQDRRFELKDINVTFPNGQLTVVTGPTASGKTALLMALLGEMSMLPGDGKLILPKYPTHIDENGLAGISYAAQSPWLQHLTIRDNIIFGAQYDEARYEAVLECCALKPDLQIFEDGDSTEIGSRGISLSGGQKARVALARAVYARTKYVLLDDPLSAVDSHTARFLYERLFQGPLLANRTVVLVTHHVELVLPGAHYLVRMLDGRIDAQGTVEALRTQGVLEAIARDSSLQASPEAKETRPDKKQSREEDEDKKKARQLVKDEAREMGSVKWRIYKTYMKASSYVTWVILSTFIVLYQILGVGEKLWIKAWGEAYNQTETTSHFFERPSFTHGEGDLHLYTQHASFSAQFTTAFKKFSVPGTIGSTMLPSATVHPLFYVAIYAAIGLAAAMIGVTNVVVQYTGALRASKLLFRQLLVAVVRATMRWHDSTPTGRMLNRFSKDIETVDTSLGSSLQAVNSSMATFFASVVTVAVLSPSFILPAIVIGYIYYRLGIGYLNTGRDLRRMESNSRSPIFAQFSELLEGIVTVRAFSSEQRFLENLYGKVDATSKMWYTFWMTNRWLLLHFDFLGALAVLFTTLFALSGAIGAGYAGVTITSAMGFTSSVYWTCRFWTQLELDLNSVERVVEYLELPQEPPTVVESNRPPAYWPSSSNNDTLVVVEDLVIRYAPELPPVLHGVSFALKARERVGLLGRTGSGKSTLAMSILRFTDPSSGSITIDSIDITTIGLHDLRSRLTFVAQDATLFSGTIRENIDPFGDFSDEECMDALRRVHLLSDSTHTSQRSSGVPSRDTSRASSPVHDVEREETLASVSTASLTATQFGDKQAIITLNTQVSTGGINFSQGQRQLLTMARALLRQSSIIILDEATSSIDFATDAKIQATIREEFKNSLLLTVAHRLRTVIDYDRLIVLDQGRIVEIDTPMNLIRKEGGVFREMCLQSGTFKELEESARRAAEVTRD